MALTALTLLNDVITHEAGQQGLPFLDLRTLFNESTDFANPIEPSAQGDRKLATTTLDVVRDHDFVSPRFTIFARREPS